MFMLLKLSLAVLATIGLYSILYKETKVYRFVEHIYLGLSSGYLLVATWKDTLYSEWWIKMVGKKATEPDGVDQMGYWIYAVLFPVSLLGYMVLNKKHNWMSKIPVGIILGLWSGQQISIWWNTYGPQIYSSLLPIIPTTFSSIAKPASVVVQGGKLVPNPDAALMAQAAQNVYPTQALSNLIFIVTLVSAFSYFIFSFELKNKALKGLNTMGRWMLMVGFGAIFGSTVMARFALVIDRMAYIWTEWLGTLFQVARGG